MPVPNMNGFASQWNIGFSIFHESGVESSVVGVYAEDVQDMRWSLFFFYIFCLFLKK